MDSRCHSVRLFPGTRLSFPTLRVSISADNLRYSYRFNCVTVIMHFKMLPCLLVGHFRLLGGLCVQLDFGVSVSGWILVFVCPVGFWC